ncbi:preprotein translocase subunit TatA [Mycobacterium sp. djl-10]|uniref:Sec-independent protein translocase subunit TatA n=1 Tax=Mycobacterium sp. MS1601 TaxID=1936029 RepID=UPI000811C86A|nr:Sec-independent protein translocase subunit TatA [Mycobacterium sp. MS1601]ANW65344.1 preprotein translocase subunit TatA [Mycobacterium sp. djl-10]AQA04965.1 Sec-independent protein translocase TatA [Mycobacterium sp. MS1601]
MGALQPWHWVILIVVFVLLFGAKRLPDAARSLGKSMRIFKSEVKELQSDKEQPTVTPQPPTATPVQSERVDVPPPASNHTDVRPA